MQPEKNKLIQVEFREVPEGAYFWKRGLTYKKIDATGAEMPGIFGRRRCPFGKSILVLMKKSEVRK